MNFWPIEEPPLGPDEVQVTHEQFEQLAKLAALHEMGLIGEPSEDMLKICPYLHKYRVNKLVVKLPQRRWLFS